MEKRAKDVEAIYTGNSLEETKKLLNHYQVSYIYVGKLEKEKYPNMNEYKFAQLGEIIFSEGQTKIYKVN